MTGLFNDIGSNSDDNIGAPDKSRLQALQSTVNQQVTSWETRDNSNTVTAYSNVAFPIDNQQSIPNNNVAVYLTLSYFDDYNMPNLPSLYNFASSYNAITTGLPTAALTNVLGTNDRLWSVNYYDDKSRPVRAILQHYLGGTADVNNYDDIVNTYDFADEVTNATRNHHTAAAGLALTIANEYVYDSGGREQQAWEQVNTDPNILLLQRDYNEIGQIVNKHLHSTDAGNSFLQNISYTYNERGWLSKINDPQSVTTDKVFAMQLYYGDDNQNLNQRTYNGNVSSMSWQTKVPAGLNLNQVQQSFDYTYDNLSRLTLANYTTPGQAGAFNEQVSYDKMDNILSLNRYSNGVQIDQLVYTYQNNNQSNTLQYVTDYSGNSAGQASGTSNYTYDGNGNMLTDDGKPIQIDYNLLNLPQMVTQTSTGQTLSYVYDASGRKLRKLIGGTTRDYVNGIEYNNSGIDFIQTEEGRAIPGSNYSYEYHLEDHLGNTRATVRQDGTISQVQDYYPFGMDMNTGNSLTPSPDDRYKYNGNEYQTEFNLNKYDYGARHYDPAIARWTVIDPLAVFYHEQSPYSYAFSNPVRFGDFGGLGPIDRINAARNMTGIPYLQQTNEGLRTLNTPEALQFMDCSEFVCRVLAADGITKGVSNMPTASLLPFLSNQSQFIHSKFPQKGDIALWDGHVGIVSDVDPKTGNFKLIHARRPKLLSQENSNFASDQTYHSGTFHGFYRPVHETPDGKVSAKTQSATKPSQAINRPAGVASKTGISKRPTLMSNSFDPLGVFGLSKNSGSFSLSIKKSSSQNPTLQNPISNDAPVLNPGAPNAGFGGSKYANYMDTPINGAGNNPPPIAAESNGYDGTNG